MQRPIPLVLLHGVGLDRSMWGPFTEQLDPDTRTWVALDLPGHGEQPALRTPQTLASLAQDVLHRLPSGRIHLVGFSLGALIAQYIARFAPERITSLTCVNSTCMRTPEESTLVEARLATAGTDFASGVEASIERWFPAHATSVAPEIIEEVRRTLLANDIESYVHAYTVFARGDREIGPELTNISAPTLAITGELDPGSTPEMSQRLGERIPNCRVQIVSGTRHMLPIEAASTLAASVNAFVEESEGSHHG